LAHTLTGRWRLGLSLSLSTAFLWGVLPMALKHLLRSLGPLTITWLRFLAALIILGLWLRLRGGLPDPRLLRGRTAALVILGIVGLVGNYVTYLVAMDSLTAAGAQTLIQLAPMLLLLGSVWLFKEPFGRWQWLGFAAFVVGLALFFNQRIALLAEQPRFLTGFLWILVSSVTWAGYALAQKQLLKAYTSPAILVLIYLAASILLLPLARLEPRLPLDGLGYALLAFCCVNTVLAYGAFAEALVHWEASRVSAALAVTPLVTIFASQVMAWIAPGSVQIEPLNALSYAGAALVVTGSMVCALLRA
jgi:drug/metabolite transporter (DMT)-like permease